MNHIGRLAHREFFTHRSYAAAARCFETQLADSDEDEIGVRLNLASSYVRLFDFDNAERHVHHVVDRPNPGLSRHGVLVSEQVLGAIALGRGRYKEAVSRFTPYIGSEDGYPLLMALLAAARLNDLHKMSEINDRATASSPETVKRLGFYVDSLHAYALSGNGKRVEAAALVRKWGTDQCIVETAEAYWRNIPGGNEVAPVLESMLKKVARPEPALQP
jgi:hypothetical protein